MLNANSDGTTNRRCCRCGIVNHATHYNTTLAHNILWHSNSGHPQSATDKRRLRLTQKFSWYKQKCELAYESNVSSTVNTKSAAATINSLDKESLTKLAEQENTTKLLVTQHRVPTIGRPRDTLHKWYRLPGDGRQRQSEQTNTHQC